jgi:GDPmannose 4,6-dehydratase
MLQADTPDDFVIATGESHSPQHFCQQTFLYFGLDWRHHIINDPTQLRSNEIPWSQGDAAKAYEILGWRADTKLDEIVRLLCEAQI